MSTEREREREREPDWLKCATWRRFYFSNVYGAQRLENEGV